MKKLILLFLAMLFVLTGCFTGAINDMGEIYSNDEKISSDTNTYNLNYIKNQTIDMQRFVGDIEFDGMDTIWKYNAEKDIEIDMSYLLTLSQGTAKLVLIQPDGTVVNITETTKDSDITELQVASLSLKEGENRIKLVAKNKARISFEFIIEMGDFFEFGFLIDWM